MVCNTRQMNCGIEPSVINFIYTIEGTKQTIYPIKYPHHIYIIPYLCKLSPICHQNSTNLSQWEFSISPPSPRYSIISPSIAMISPVLSQMIQQQPEARDWRNRSPIKEPSWLVSNHGMVGFKPTTLTAWKCSFYVWIHHQSHKGYIPQLMLDFNHCHTWL